MTVCGVETVANREGGRVSWDFCTFRFEEPPAIGVVGSLSLAVELNGTTFTTLEELTEFVEKKLEYLVIARPTAVNMTDCQRKLTALVHSMAADKAATVDAVKAKYGWVFAEGIGPILVWF